MRYLVIDALLSGTGIRDKYEGGYLTPENLGLSYDIINRLKGWLLKYENEYYSGFNDDKIIDELDKEGKEIALEVKYELPDVNVEYFSDARMTSEII